MTRVLSGVTLIAVAIAIVWSNQRLVFELAAFVLLFAASYELISLFRAGGITVSRWPSMIASLLTLATFSGILGANIPVPTTDAVLLVALIGLAFVSMRTWRSGGDGLTTISASLFPSLYVALPIGAMVAIREQGPAPLFLVMLTVIVSDTAQYYTGRLTGRHLLAPAISPKKTVEGAVGGVVFGTLLFVSVGQWAPPVIRVISLWFDVDFAMTSAFVAFVSSLPMGVRVVIGFGLVIVGIAGDLFESMLKRSAGVKDSSSIIPGHGGILDRIDALLFAAPLFYVAGHFIRI
jgi:phosphatidate cytidylyltransferase